MEQPYEGQQILINQKMSVYNFNGEKSVLTIQECVSNITINGSKNKIIIKAKVPNMIVNGSKNEINCEHTNSGLSNLIFNGSYNKVSCNRRSCNFNKIDNGGNNVVTLAEGSDVSNGQSRGGNQYGFNNQFFNNFNNFSTSNSNYTIRINNNFGNIDTGNIFEFINRMTGNINMNLQVNNNNNGMGTRATNSQQSAANGDESFDEDEEEVGEGNDNQGQNEEEMTDDNYREYLPKKRQEYILELNEFQFKNQNKFMARKEDTCAICLEKFKGIDKVTQFSCNEHIFHSKCLISWLKTSNYCPLCKYDLMDDITVEDDN